jgi:hypothetical protein
MASNRIKDDPTSPRCLFACHDEGPITYLQFLAQDELSDPNPCGDMGKLWATLEAVFARKQRVLVLLVPRDLTGTRNMERFWEKVKGLSPEYQACGWGWFPVSSRTLTLQREENSFRRFVEAVTSTDTFVICVMQGEVMLPFLGLALACDYRIVTDGTVFINRCLDTGFPACGALAWFLVRHVGYGRAAHLLMNRDRIEASEAFELSLVDRLVEPEDVQDSVRSCAEQFAGNPGGGLRATKRLLAAAGHDLATYLTEEGTIFEKWLIDQCGSM